MAIKYAPDVGTIIFCDFRGTIHPEMNKKRPVVVMSNVSSRLCLIVPLSTTTPETPKAWHYFMNTPKPLPYPYDSKAHWAKCDMIFAASFDRLSMPCDGKDNFGKRIYIQRKISIDDLKAIKKGIAEALCN